MNLGLARVSSPKQLEQGYSIPAQVEKINHYCKKEKIKFDLPIFKIDETAKEAGKRKDFQEVLNILQSKNKHKHILIVEKMDRLLRNPDDAYVIDKLVRDGCLVIHFIDEHFIYDETANSHTKLMFGIKSKLAEFYKDLLAEESKKGVMEKVKRGEYPSMAPVGYINIPRTKKSAGKIIIDAERAPLVKKAYELYATGNYNLVILTKEMKKLGLTTKKGNSIGKAAIHWMLRNPFYYGEFLWAGKLWSNRGVDEDREPSYQPIITKDLFDEVQEVLAGKKVIKTKPKSGWWGAHDALFRGTIVCSNCGCHLLADRKKVKRYKDKKVVGEKEFVYWRCSNGKGKDWYKKKFGITYCPTRWYKEEEVIEAFTAAVEMLHFDKEIFDWVREQLGEEIEDRRKVVATQIENLRIEQTKKENHKSDLVRAVASETDTTLKQAFKEEYEKIRDRLDEIKVELRELEDETDDYVEEGLESIELLSNGLKIKYLNALKQAINGGDKAPVRKMHKIMYRTVFTTPIPKEKYPKNYFIPGFEPLQFHWNEPFESLFEIGIIKADAEWGVEEGMKTRLNGGGRKASIDSLDWQGREMKLD